MTPFSTFLRFGDNFCNQDVVRLLSFFLNQRDKIALSESARGVHQALLSFLPTAKKYITTVKPNLMSAFSSDDNGVYSHRSKRSRSASTATSATSTRA